MQFGTLTHCFLIYLFTNKTTNSWAIYMIKNIYLVNVFVFAKQLSRKLRFWCEQKESRYRAIHCGTLEQASWRRRRKRKRRWCFPKLKKSGWRTLTVFFCWVHRKCKEKLTFIKEYNPKCHYENYKGDGRKKGAKQLQRGQPSQQAAVEASYVIGELIAEAGKSFTEVPEGLY